jgi:hypothetical protein
MITEVAFLPMHRQHSAELRARAAAYRLARSATPPAFRRIPWPRLGRRQPAGVPVRAA